MLRISKQGTDLLNYAILLFRTKLFFFVEWGTWIISSSFCFVVCHISLWSFKGSNISFDPNSPQESYMFVLSSPALILLAVSLLLMVVFIVPLCGRKKPKKEDKKNNKEHKDKDIRKRKRDQGGAKLNNSPTSISASNTRKSRLPGRHHSENTREDILDGMEYYHILKKKHRITSVSQYLRKWAKLWIESANANR